MLNEMDRAATAHWAVQATTMLAAYPQKSQQEGPTFSFNRRGERLERTHGSIREALGRCSTPFDHPSGQLMHWPHNEPGVLLSQSLFHERAP